MGKGRYTPCPGCGCFIEWDDEVHTPWCPAADRSDYGACTGTCPSSGICAHLGECWDAGLAVKLIRHGERSLLEYHTTRERYGALLDFYDTSFESIEAQQEAERSLT